MTAGHSVPYVGDVGDGLRAAMIQPSLHTSSAFVLRRRLALTAFSAPTPRVRPVAVTASAAILTLDARRTFASLGGLRAGANIPAAAIAVAFGVADFIAALGLWGLHKWAATLALVAAVLSVLLSVTGAFGAESATGKVIAVVGVILGITVIVAVIHPTARRAFV